MKVTGTLAEVKSVSKQLRKYGWRNSDLSESLDKHTGGWTLTMYHASVSPSQVRPESAKIGGED